MSATSDQVKKLIDNEIKKQKDKLDLKVDNAINLYRAGNEKADKLVNDIEKNIEKAKKSKERVDSTIDSIKVYTNIF